MKEDRHTFERIRLEAFDVTCAIFFTYQYGVVFPLRLTVGPQQMDDAGLQCKVDK